MSDVPPPTEVAPPADAGAATTGGDAAANTAAELSPDISEAQFAEVDVPDSGAYGGIDQGEGGQDPTAIPTSDVSETPDVSEAQFAEVDLPTSDAQADVLEGAGEGVQQSEELRHYLDMASDIASKVEAGAPTVLKELIIGAVDSGNVLTGMPFRLEDAVQSEAVRDYLGGWIRVNAPELAQRLDRIFGKGW